MPRLDRDDCLYIDDVPFPALLAGADVVFTKPGYGVLAESIVAGARVVWLDRGRFPEAPFLEAAMRDRGDVKAAAATGEAVAEAVATALATARTPGRGRDDRARVADAVLAG
jgi:hypothetical protein